MLSELNKALCRRYLKAYETGDIGASIEFLDPKYVLHPGRGEKAMNREERKRDETDFFQAFSNIRVTVEDQIAEGDRVANRVMMECTHSGKYQNIPATGKRIKIPYVDIILIRNGKICEEWTEYDMMNIIQQIRSKNEK
jgi:steroid delta-isomerase-like uncharacterized protein